MNINHFLFIKTKRNDVNRICKPETVVVDRLMQIERYSHVMHIVSRVKGQLRDEQEPLQAFRSIFPAGTVSGAPKIRAMELVASLEKESRRVYAGAVGYYSFNQRLDTCIALRTIVYKKGIAYLQAGGGIVFDSDEKAEYEETMHKMGALRKTIKTTQERQDKYSENPSTIYPLYSKDELTADQQSFNEIFLQEKQNENNNLDQKLQPKPSMYQKMISNYDRKQGCVLMIDNYDSFTWNLYQYLSRLGQQVIVARNDEISIEECEQLNPHHIVLSPGPGHPSDAGICAKVLEHFAGKIPILGVCLGHQVMTEFYGGLVNVCSEIKHGKTSIITHDKKGIYTGIQHNFSVIRYHSLVAEITKIPDCLEITSRSEIGYVMGLRHKEFTIEGVQYHPESIKTEFGEKMLTNFLSLKKGTWNEENQLKVSVSIRDCVKKLSQKKQLTGDEMRSVMNQIMSNDSFNVSQVSAFLSLLSIRPCDGLITSDILKACSDVMLEYASPCHLPFSTLPENELPLIDIVGTGGDGKDAFNVSTASCFLVAACGCRIGKHGNRSSSGSVGSSDFLESLGINIHLNSEQVAKSISECGFSFLFAPYFHSSMRNVSQIRKDIGVRTIFNLLGPLTNPLKTTYQLAGVADETIGEIYVELLHKLGKKNPMVVHSFDGLDEVSISSRSHLWTYDSNTNKILHEIISPEDFGIPLYSEPLESLPKVVGGTAEERASYFLDILSGNDVDTPLYHFIVLNAALALITVGITNDKKKATELVKDSLKSGKAKQIYENYKSVSNSFNKQDQNNQDQQENLISTENSSSNSSKDNNKESILDVITNKTKDDLENRKKQISLDEMKEKAEKSIYKVVHFQKRLTRAGKIGVLAEIKRASPSKGDINTDIHVDEQALLYANSGAATISVLTEPHWFKGSLEDMEEARKSVSHFDELRRPAILRKDFIFDEYQIYEARSYGADTILLIVSIINSQEKLSNLISIARKLNMEPLVEVNSVEETKIAISSGAKVIGINNRNLHTFNVNLNTSEDIISNIQLNRNHRDIFFIALSGIQSRSDVERYENIGIRGVLVGEALMKSNNPSRLIKSLTQSFFVPFVKICGIKSIETAASAIESGADMIGLVFTKSVRQVSIDEGKQLVQSIRYLSNQSTSSKSISIRELFNKEIKTIQNEKNTLKRLGKYANLLEKAIQLRKPLIVGVFANQSAEEILDIAKQTDIDIIQLSGSHDHLKYAYLDDNHDFLVFKAIHVSSFDSSDLILSKIEKEGKYCTNILFDTHDPLQAGGTGVTFNWDSISVLSKQFQIPFMLAGGLNLINVHDAVSQVLPFAIDVSSGVEFTRGVKSNEKIKSFIQLAKFTNFPILSQRQERELNFANCSDNKLSATKNISPLIAIQPPGWFGNLGGRFAPESLMQALEELEVGYYKAIQDPLFIAEVKQIASHYIGRSTPLFYAKQLTKHCNGARIWLKREDLNHTGAHKINNAIAQAILAKRLGKKRIIAETGAGQHGVATATACAMLKLECIVYMGAEDCRRQELNVLRMRNLGATVIPVQSGSKTLKDAINEAMRDWVTNVSTTHYLVGSAIGPHPFPVLVRDFQCIIGTEIKQQMLLQAGKLPDAVIACVGGGSNAIGTFHPFIDHPVLIYGVEAAGEGVEFLGKHSATIVAGSVGVLHGTRTWLIQDENGQITNTHSVSAGLDYPGVGPEHAFIADSGRGSYVPVTDYGAYEGFKLLNQHEGIVPALESSHALYFGMELASTLSTEDDIVICVSGRGDKDMGTVTDIINEKIILKH